MGALFDAVGGLQARVRAPSLRIPSQIQSGLLEAAEPALGALAGRAAQTEIPGLIDPETGAQGLPQVRQRPGLAGALTDLATNPQTAAQTLSGLLGANLGQPSQEQMALGRRQAEADLSATQARREASEAAGALSQARLANIPLENAMALGSQQAQIADRLADNAVDFQKLIRTNPGVLKGVEALTAWEQVNAALDLNNPVALQSAIVGTVQIQEPGLAVRNDDRIAYTGNNPLMENLVNSYNRLVSGTVEEGTSERIRELARELVLPRAAQLERILADYSATATRIPGATQADVTAGLGFDPLILQELTQQADFAAN